MKRDPTLEVDEFGTKRYFTDGKLHREDGPAIEYSDGDKYWYVNDQLHREDVPAIEWYGGNKRWYYEDQYIESSSQEEFEKIIRLKAFW